MALSAWERKRLLKHGKMTRIAKRTHFTVQHVSQVMKGFRRNATIERHIAREIGLPVEEVFEPIGSAGAPQSAA